MSFYNKYKSTINVVLGVAAVGTAYYVYQQNKKKKELEAANQAGAAAAAELDNLAASGVHPSYGDSQFQIFSDQLVQAMTGCGTDEDMVYSVFRAMKNDADVLKLIAIFGVRFYQPCAWTSPVSYAIWQVNDQAYGGGIGAWLGYDLSDTEIGNINSILKSNGINYQF